MPRITIRLDNTEYANVLEEIKNRNGNVSKSVMINNMLADHRKYRDVIAAQKIKEAGFELSHNERFMVNGNPDKEM